LQIKKFSDYFGQKFILKKYPFLLFVFEFVTIHKRKRRKQAQGLISCSLKQSNKGKEKFKMSNNPVMLESNFMELGEPRRGKVRDIYDLGHCLLLVATDRISAFDVVMPNGIPGKGHALTAISNIWFNMTREIIPNHVISTDVNAFSVYCPEFEDQFKRYAEQLEGRCMLVEKAKPFPVEAIVRGHISGSGWKEYQKTQTICGIPLPAGLVESEKLPETIFTPSTKAPDGQHDENISFEDVVIKIGPERAKKIKDVSLEIYANCAELALQQGIIIADTKFEFGVAFGDRIILIDEVLTPDSSRFWPVDQYRPGGPQPSFDKQFLRDWLGSLNWNKTPPAPNLPRKVIEGTQERYLKALELISKIRNNN
jgi:phosphoribosylaminoimidazole-succinocarboxamide synthase